MNRRGFTIVELAIVILIIAIIAAIALPALGRARNANMSFAALPFSVAGYDSARGNLNLVIYSDRYTGGSLTIQVSLDQLRVLVRTDGQLVTALTGVWDYDEWKEVTIWVPDENDRAAWANYISRYMEANPRYPRRVLPPEK